MNDMSPRSTGPTLSDALATTYDPALDDRTFAQRLAALAGSLTNAPKAFVISAETLTDLAVSHGRPTEDINALAAMVADAPDRSARTQGDLAAAPLALPEGGKAALVIQLPPGGTVAGALALERLTGLAALSQATHRNAEAYAFRRVIDAVSGSSLEELAGALHGATDADNVAIARLADEVVTELSISGQPEATTRAALPDALRQELPIVARAATRGPGDYVANGPSGTFVVRVDHARRNGALADVAVKALASGAEAPRLGRGAVRRLVKRLVVVGALLGLAFVPVPDGRRISASVSAVEERVVTAPFTGVLATISVRENDAVVASETVLATFEAREITQELIAVQADHAKALLERETARAGRDATALRNAELEAERLRAQIELLEARREAATIVAPISGLAAGEGLGDLQGATLRQGETILRVLDPGALRLSLEISDEDVGDLEDGVAGVFRPDFDPSRTYQARVTSISPALSEREDIAVFSGRAGFEGATEGLSPGLRGVLVVDREWKPVWQVVRDGVRKWVLLRVWF